MIFPLFIKVKEEEKENAAEPVEEKSITDLKAGNVQDLIIKESAGSFYEFCNDVLQRIADFTNAGAALLYTNKSDKFILTSMFAVSEDSVAKDIEPGEGIAGQAIQDQKTILINNLESETLKIFSGLGHVDSVTLIELPFIHNNKVVALSEVAIMNSMSSEQIRQLESFADVVANKMTTFFK